MPTLKEQLRGFWEITKNTRFLLTHFGLLQAANRTQEITKSGFHHVYAVETPKIRLDSSDINRLAVLDNQFTTINRIGVDTEYIRAHYEHIVQTVGSNEAPLSILEVGAGHGRTLCAMTCLFPKSDFYAIEYTESGPSSTAAYMRDAVTEIQSVAGNINPLCHQNHPQVKEMITGDAKNMPYADEQFDISYTNLVLEQIPKPEDHLQVLREMYRVTKRYCFFLEPWKESQDPLTMAYLKYNDYFRQPSDMLYEIGFKKVTWYPNRMQHNLKFKTGYAVAEK